MRSVSRRSGEKTHPSQPSAGATALSTLKRACGFRSQPHAEGCFRLCPSAAAVYSYPAAHHNAQGRQRRLAADARGKQYSLTGHGV